MQIDGECGVIDARRYTGKLVSGVGVNALVITSVSGQLF